MLQMCNSRATLPQDSCYDYNPKMGITTLITRIYMSIADGVWNCFTATAPHYIKHDTKND